MAGRDFSRFGQSSRRSGSFEPNDSSPMIAAEYLPTCARYCSLTDWLDDNGRVCYNRSARGTCRGAVRSAHTDRFTQLYSEITTFSFHSRLICSPAYPGLHALQPNCFQCRPVDAARCSRCTHRFLFAMAKSLASLPLARTMARQSAGNLLQVPFAATGCREKRGFPWEP